MRVHLNAAATPKLQDSYDPKGAFDSLLSAPLEAEKIFTFKSLCLFPGERKSIEGRSSLASSLLLRSSPRDVSASQRLRSHLLKRSMGLSLKEESDKVEGSSVSEIQESTERTKRNLGDAFARISDLIKYGSLDKSRKENIVDCDSNQSTMDYHVSTLSDLADSLEIQVKKIRELASQSQNNRLDVILNAKQEGVATSAYEVLTRIFSETGRVLGRNSPEAIRADTIARIQLLTSSGSIPEYVGGRGSSPEDWVEANIVPKLDPDMKKFAFDMDVYSRPIKKLYNTIKVWRSLGYSGVSRFVNRRA